MRWYECKVRFVKGRPFYSDVRASDQQTARDKAKQNAIEAGRTEIVLKVTARPLKG